MTDLSEAKQELSRADHLFYVTLKHNRTADILKQVIDKLVSAFEKLILYYLNKLYLQGEIEAVPKTPKEQLDLFVDLLEKKNVPFNVREFAQFYLMLRKLKRSQYYGKNEYRRAIKIVFKLPSGEEIEYDTKTIKDILEKAKQYFNILEQIVK